MRKRQDLDARISSVLRLEQTIEDNVGLIELGELEGDHVIVSEAEKVPHQTPVGSGRAGT